SDGRTLPGCPLGAGQYWSLNGIRSRGGCVADRVSALVECRTRRVPRRGHLGEAAGRGAMRGSCAGRRRAVELGGDMTASGVARVGRRDIVSSGDRAAVLGLRRGPGQDQYLNSMEEIFAEADQEQRAMPHPWAVHDADTGALVGFAMISDNIPQPIDGDLVGPCFRGKLLIDRRCQRRGYGAATLDAVVDYLRTRPGAEVLYTSCTDGPGSPRGFYLRYGFTDTGRVMWGENVLALDLAARG